MNAPPDIGGPAARSSTPAGRAKLALTERMARIQKANTKPELAVRRLLHALGFRFRLHGKHLPGTPDIVFPRARKVIFVHGCFWHRHHCRDGQKFPTSKPEYWGPKFHRNVARDNAAQAQLRGAGWEPLVLWECELRNLDALARRLTDFLGPLVSLAEKGPSTSPPSPSAPPAPSTGPRHRKAPTSPPSM
jgi:DNA mismatch endonuclease (patch repair protein)